MRNERFLSCKDAAELCRLAESLLRVRDVNFNSGEKLIDLIARSILIPESDSRRNVVSLRSEVTYRFVDTRDIQSTVIACPRYAFEALAHLSILTPLSLALIGRRVGSIVEVDLPFNRTRHAEILAVQPARVPSLDQITTVHSNTSIGKASMPMEIAS